MLLHYLLSETSFSFTSAVWSRSEGEQQWLVVLYSAFSSAPQTGNPVYDCEIYKPDPFRGSFCVGVAQSGARYWRGSWEGSVSTVMKELHYSIGSLLHTPQVSWKAAWGIFRHVWTALHAVCLTSLTFSLTPTFLAQLTEALSKHKHLSLEWQRGN